MRRSLAFLACAAFACGGSTTPAPDTTTSTSSSSSGSATSTCDASAASAREKIAIAIKANQACTSADDCVTIENNTSCYDACNAAIAKAGLAKLDAVKADVNANECKAFKQAGCSFTVPPCVPPSPPKCVDKLCQ